LSAYGGSYGNSLKGGYEEMVLRMPTHCGDETCPSCIVAGDYIFLAHHAGGHERNDIVYQMEACFNSLKNTLESVGASLDDMVQLNLYLKNLDDFQQARDVFFKYFSNGKFPARMTTTTNFLSQSCLCMIDGIAYMKSQVDA
jgi:2-iminobutanoate/2-iminopropanoate deaminase